MPGFQRVPYVEKFIKDLRVDDFRVSVSGVVVDSGDGSFMVDDGTGRVVVVAPDESRNVVGKVVRVLGAISPADDGVLMHADIVQDWSVVDASLLKKVKDRVLDGKTL